MGRTTLCSEAPDQLCSVKEPSLAWHSSTDQFLVTEGRGRPLPAPPHTPAPLTYLQGPKGSVLSASNRLRLQLGLASLADRHLWDSPLALSAPPVCAQPPPLPLLGLIHVCPGSGPRPGAEQISANRFQSQHLKPRLESTPGRQGSGGDGPRGGTNFISVPGWPGWGECRVVEQACGQPGTVPGSLQQLTCHSWKIRGVAGPSDTPS